jgi:hypothetical protein
VYVSTDLRVSYIYRYKGASLTVMEAFSVSVYRSKGMLMSIDGRVCAMCIELRVCWYLLTSGCFTVLSAVSLFSIDSRVCCSLWI